MNPIKEVEEYMIKYDWRTREDLMIMLRYISEKEGEKLDLLLKETMRRVKDPKESCVLVPNGLIGLINHNFLDSAVSYYRYRKAKRLMEQSKNEL